MTNNKTNNPQTAFLQAEPVEINDIELLEVAGGMQPTTGHTSPTCTTATLQPSNFIC